MRLERDFYAQPAQDVAVQLLGAHLVRRRPDGEKAVGRIVEVEAYTGPEDLACHASKGRTARTEVMFGPPGHAYVYLIYGMHHCFNVVTGLEGHAAAVLVRALEPVAGIGGPTQGPGRLCQALGISRAQNGMDLCGDEIFVQRGRAPRRVVATARIGVDYAGRWARRRLRFIDPDSLFVSGPRKR
jgi:DNA-3-methyladenine glycosylase